MNDKGENPEFTLKLEVLDVNRSNQIARGPRSSRTGSMKSALSKPKTPLTVIPTIRKGNVRSHTMGYKTSASSANGQQRTKRMHHNRKAAMETSVLADSEQPMPTASQSLRHTTLSYDAAGRNVSSTSNLSNRKRFAMEAGTSACKRIWESSSSVCKTRPRA